MIAIRMALGLQLMAVRTVAIDLLQRRGGGPLPKGGLQV